MKKILFLIHDLGPGGAEKVLVNLVNNMDKTKYDITIHSLFDVGINKQFLKPHIHYVYSFKNMIRGNSKLLKLLTPKQLHKWLIKDTYDIEISYLEGPCSRIISGCENKKTKTLAWIHREQKTRRVLSSSFRSIREATYCYNCFDRIICVSKTVQKDFEQLVKLERKSEVYYNTNETEKILSMAKEKIKEPIFKTEGINIVGVGKLLSNKGFDRILRIVYRLRKEGIPVNLYILGTGPEENKLKKYIRENNMGNYTTLLGYQTNPYKYLSKCELFVCASYAEGFSTAATEALIVGIPVCTVEVSGMKEMLGENNEYGVITKNNDESLYQEIKELVTNTEKLQYYKQQASRRGKDFSTEKTIQEVEKLLWNI